MGSTRGASAVALFGLAGRAERTVAARTPVTVRTGRVDDHRACWGVDGAATHGQQERDRADEELHGGTLVSQQQSILGAGRGAGLCPRNLAPPLSRHPLNRFRACALSTPVDALMGSLMAPRCSWCRPGCAHCQRHPARHRSNAGRNHCPVWTRCSCRRGGTPGRHRRGRMNTSPGPGSGIALRRVCCGCRCSGGCRCASPRHAMAATQVLQPGCWQQQDRPVLAGIGGNVKPEWAPMAPVWGVGRLRTGMTPGV